MSVFTQKNIIHEIDDFMNFMMGDNYFLDDSRRGDFELDVDDGIPNFSEQQ